MAFPKGCANLDKLYSGFSSSSPPLPSLLHLFCCFSSSLLAEQGIYAKEKRVGEGKLPFVVVFSPDSSPAASPSLSLSLVSVCLSVSLPLNLISKAHHVLSAVSRGTWPPSISPFYAHPILSSPVTSRDGQRNNPSLISVSVTFFTLNQLFTESTSVKNFTANTKLEVTDPPSLTLEIKSVRVVPFISGLWGVKDKKLIRTDRLPSSHVSRDLDGARHRGLWLRRGCQRLFPG